MSARSERVLHVSLFFFIVVHVVGNLHFFKGTNRRVQRVRLFLCSFVLYMPWIPGEHSRRICSVECVTAHLRGFEEVLRSEVVFWIDDHSFEFGYHWLMSLMFLTTHFFQFRFVDSEHGYFYVRLYCTCLGFQANIVEEYVLLSALQHIFVGLKRTRDQMLFSGLMSCQLSLAITG